MIATWRGVVRGALATAVCTTAMRAAFAFGGMRGGAGVDEEPPPAQWRLTMDGGANYAIFSPGPFAFVFPDPLASQNPATFKRQMGAGGGVGFAFGLGVEYTLAKRWSAFASVGYASRTGVFEQDNAATVPDSLTGELVRGTVTDHLLETIGDVTVRFGIHAYVTPHFFVTAGAEWGTNMLLATAYTLDEQLVAPSTAYYTNDSGYYATKQLRSVGRIGNSISAQLGGLLGVGAEFPLSDEAYLIPELSATFPFEPIIDGLNLKSTVVTALVRFAVSF